MHIKVFLTTSSVDVAFTISYDAFQKIKNFYEMLE